MFERGSSLLVVGFSLACLVACGEGESSSGVCEADDECPSGYACSAGQCVIAGVTPGDGGDGGGDGDAAVGDGDGGGADGGGDGAAPDVQGPNIEIVSPIPYQLVGANLYVEVKVSDAQSGVDRNSVYANIGPEFASEPDMVVALTQADGVFTANVALDFDYLAFPYIAVVARDRAGNRSEAGHAVSLDNTPPVVSLSSPKVQLDDAGTCSRPFYPLGDPANDIWLLVHGRIFSSTTQNVVTRPRARIEDYGNYVGQPTGVFSGVAAGSTRLYLQKRASVSDETDLVVGDGTSSSRCVTINPTVRPSGGAPVSGEALVQQFVEVEPSGAGDYSGGVTSSDACPTGGTRDAPDPVCRSAPSDLTVWLHRPLSDPPIGSVFVLNSYDAESPLTCAGGPFDTSNLPGDGIYCAAAYAEDEVGNGAASNPIAFCVDRDGLNGECTGFASVADAVAARCSDGCVSPEFPGGAVYSAD